MLGLPLDVSNNAGSLECSYKWGSQENCGQLDMVWYWSMIFCACFALITVILPFAIFYYEAIDDTEVGGKQAGPRQAAGTATCYTFFVVLAAGLTLGIMFGMMGQSEIPVQSYTLQMGAATDGGGSTRTVLPPITNLTTTSEMNTRILSGALTTQEALRQSRAVEAEDIVTFDVTFPVYVVALYGWVGWFFFCVFGGVGLASLPTSLIAAYVYRPIRLSAKAIAERQLSIARKSGDLLEVGDSIKRDRAARSAVSGWREKRRLQAADRQKSNRFKQMVYLIEQEAEELRECAQFSKHNPLIPLFKLFLGSVFALLSLLWVIHMALYMFRYNAEQKKPINGFLNHYFIQFDTWFPLFGVMSVAIFGMYLLLCVVSGCFKIGMRFFCITLHPMIPNGTYMNSFLFNVGLIVLCTLPVVQFCTMAFADYARYSSINVILSVEVKHLKWFDRFFANNSFIWTFFAFFLLSLVWSFCTAKRAEAKPAGLAVKMTTNPVRSNKGRGR